MMKAFRLTIVAIELTVLYLLYIPVLIISIASWPFRIVTWLLVGHGAGGVRSLFTRLQEAIRRAELRQRALAYGFKDVNAYLYHLEMEHIKRKAEKAARKAGKSPASASTDCGDLDDMSPDAAEPVG
jgi:hypothetical protein